MESDDELLIEPRFQCFPCAARRHGSRQSTTDSKVKARVFQEKDSTKSKSSLATPNSMTRSTSKEELIGLAAEQSGDKTTLARSGRTLSGGNKRCNTAVFPDGVSDCQTSLGEEEQSEGGRVSGNNGPSQCTATNNTPHGDATRSTSTSSNKITTQGRTSLLWRSQHSAPMANEKAGSCSNTKKTENKKRTDRKSWEVFNHSGQYPDNGKAGRRPSKSAGASTGSNSEASTTTSLESQERLKEVKEKVRRAEGQAQAAEAELMKLLDAVREKEKEVGEVMVVLDSMKERMRLAREQAEMLRQAGALAGPSNALGTEDDSLPRATSSDSFSTDIEECLKLLDGEPKRPLRKSHSAGKDVLVFLTQSRNSMSGECSRVSITSRDGLVTDNRGSGMIRTEDRVSGSGPRSSMQDHVHVVRRRLCLSVWDAEAQLQAAQQQLVHLDLAAGDARMRLAPTQQVETH